MRGLILGAGGLLVGAALWFGTRGDAPKDDAKTASEEPAIVAEPAANPAPPPMPVPAPTQAPIAPTDPAAPPPSPLDDEDSVATSDDAAPSSFDEAMAATDPFVRRDAIEKAIARKDVSALPKIQAVDLTQDGYVAASAIDAVGKLGAIASPAAKTDAVRTLDKWLKQESKRAAPEALGNASIAVDALADTKSNEAIAPLVSALDGASLPLHIETRNVQALDSLDAKSAAPSVARFAARVSKLTPADDFEKALAAEALQAANDALTKWGSSP